MVGLARGAVKRCAHEKEWELQARNTIFRLKQILGHAMQDIQHMGSASIPSIKAKPIIDIAAAVDNFDDVLRFEKELKAAGFHYRPAPRPLSKASCCSPAAVIARARAIFKRISSMLSAQTARVGSIT